MWEGSWWERGPALVGFQKKLPAQFHFPHPSQILDAVPLPADCWLPGLAPTLFLHPGEESGFGSYQLRKKRPRADEGEYGA